MLGCCKLASVDLSWTEACDAGVRALLEGCGGGLEVLALQGCKKLSAAIGEN